MGAGDQNGSPSKFHKGGKNGGRMHGVLVININS